MRALPTGTVTFLFTDIEGSTRLAQDLGEVRFKQVLTDHRRLLADAVESAGGSVYQDQGESFVFVFDRAKEAVVAAVAGQRALWNHAWPGGRQPRVRMGLHTGEPIGEAGQYVGLDVHRAARICSVGHGGQILVSQTLYDLVADDLPDGIGLRDMGEHRLKDLGRPVRLYQVMASELPDEFPSLKSLDSFPNNLPQLLTSFVGREEEKADVRRLLSKTHLLTCTGPGGSGKTRLALEVAAAALEEFKDGVWFVELASVSDPAFVANAISSAMNIPEQPGRPLTKTLEDYLRAKSLLLVLDNCEHMVSACADLVETLLRACTDLRVLATSREPLSIEGETAYRVPSLSVPDAATLPLERLTRYGAVMLFIDRATAALPSFRVSAHNAKAVATLCRLLDGIPLAIELVAPKVNALSVEHITERLHDRFGMLTSGRRTAIRRHQTLRAALDWSYDLLSEPERVLFKRLTVFAGGFTLEAAESVGASQVVGAADIMDLLGRLVEKSLVMFQEQQERYRLLETVRQYGREQLVASGEEAAVREKHRDWYLALAEEASPGLHGPQQRMWLQTLDREHDNLRAALEWSKTVKDGAEKGLRLAGAVYWYWWYWWYWYMSGYLSEGRRRLEDALARSDEAASTVMWKPLVCAAVFGWRQGDYERAAALAEKAAALCREMENNEGLGYSLWCMGLLAQAQADYERATALQRDSLALAREAQDRWLIAVVLAQLGIIAEMQGEYRQAVTYQEEGLVVMRGLGDDNGIAYVLSRLGRAVLGQGDYKRAAVAFAESLTLSTDVGFLWVWDCLEGLAGVAGGERRYGVAARLFGAAEKICATLGLRRTPGRQPVYEQRLASTRAGLGEQAFAAAWAAGQEMTMEQAIEYALSE